MGAACLIVCEKTPRWASAFRLALGGKGPRVVETRGISGLEAALGEAPASLAAIETTATGVNAAVEVIDRLTRRFPLARMIALVAPEEMDAAGLLREAGAVDVLSSTCEAPRVAGLARRQMARAPREEVSLREWVAERMPWAAFAASAGD
jgi:hypothetical protein